MSIAGFIIFNEFILSPFKKAKIGDIIELYRNVSIIVIKEALY